MKTRPEHIVEYVHSMVPAMTADLMRAKCDVYERDGYKCVSMSVVKVPLSFGEEYGGYLMFVRDKEVTEEEQNEED